MSLIESGVNVVADRYSFSGIAYSAAKGLDLEWCKAPDKGLPKPDIVIYIDLPIECIKARAGFGEEKYENTEFLAKVAAVYENIFDPTYWLRLNGDMSTEELNKKVAETVEGALDKCEGKQLATLF